jgi:hypothetical protein
MELGQSSKKLIELVRRSYEGEVMLPDFQRNFVWTRQDVEELIKSLLENTFIGTFLIHHVNPNDLPFKTIAIEGAKEVNSNFNENATILVLDGQQRLSSLFYAIYSPNIPLRNVSNPYAFFIDINELLNDNIDDAVFSYSKEHRYYKNYLKSNNELDIKLLKEDNIIPLSFLAKDFTEIWYRDYKSNFSEDQAKKIKQYIDNIINYNILTLDVPISEKPENIAALFEKINRTGVKLSIFDLLTARLYKFLNLREEWEKSFEDSINLQKFSLKNKRDTTIPYYIIQSIALSQGLSIKARDMLKIDDVHLNKDIWTTTASEFDTLLNRVLDINEYGIGNISKWLSYKPMIITLTSLFKLENKDINKINSWYWSCIFSERYGSSTETKLTKDYKDVKQWFMDDNKIPESIQDARELLDNNVFKLTDKKNSGNSSYKGVFNLLFISDARDFYENDKIKFSNNDLDDHHIFPKKFLENKNVDVQYDMVLNRTLITSTTNKKISKKAPATYLQEMLKNNSNDESTVKKILEKHFINNEMYELLKEVKEDSSAEKIHNLFEEFVSKREKLIKDKIKELIY